MKPSSSKTPTHPARRQAAAGAGLMFALAAGAAAADYRLDPQASFVHAEVLHFNTSTIRARFGPIEGRVSIDPAAGRGETGLRISTAGVSTGSALFDSRLREPDLLAAESHPEAWFVARDFRFVDGRLAEVRGELTLRDTSQGLALKALSWSCRPDIATGRERCGGDFEGELQRADFGLTFGLPFVGGRVRLRVQVEGVREP